MILKRKRSDPELCSSPSSSSSVSSSPPSNGLLDVHPQAFINMPAAHLHSRTFKRYRDSRPSEERVHQRTLNLLYSASQQQQSTQGVRGPPPQPDQRAVVAAQPSTQQSLHRFWSINSAPVAPQVHLGRSPAPAPCTCEDCGARLGGDDLATGKTACGACGKHVCFSCSVSNLGDEKRCLQCAGRKVWAGAVDGRLGWTDAAMSTC